MIVFSHILNTANSGDKASGPYRWFPFPDNEVVNYDAAVPDCDAVVYGGGTMVNWLRGRTHPDAKRILWGAGSSRKGEIEPWPDPEGFDLIGTREWTPEREASGRYVPCASCMSSLFDYPYTIEREAVVFVNASDSIKSQYPVAVGGLPVMENDRPMGEIVAFLGSGKNVITNSYHGVYWATLLRRRVICLPYSSKFHGFKYPPEMSRDGGLDWRVGAKAARNYYGVLEDCRAANRAFHTRVMDLLC